MKFKSTRHWKAKNSEGLLFFAQIIDEALFDYTLETYKPRSLNSRLLCIEALKTIDFIKKGLIKSPNLQSIIDELVWAISADTAVKAILGYKLESFTGIIKQNVAKYNILKESILLLYHHLDDKKYMNKIKELLIEKISVGREKEKIYSLTKTFLTELINYGYSPNYIYFKCSECFFNKENAVETNSPELFFNVFQFEQKKFEVLYRVSIHFKEFVSIVPKWNLEMFTEYELDQSIIGKSNFLKGKKSDEIFVLCKEIIAFDDYKAKIFSEFPLSKIANLFCFYHHKEKPFISENAVVFNKTDQTSIVLENPQKSIIKKEDVKPMAAVQKVRLMVDTLNLPKVTMLRIGRAIDLHSIALETSELENKLLNLWTAIETLIPKDTESGKDRIQQIIDSIVPSQTINYFNQILKQAASDFYNYNNTLAKETLAKVVLKKKESFIDTIFALISTKENELIRNELLGNLDKYPLLRYRLFLLNKIFDNSSEAESFLSNHQKRVEWQIRRIYRVRNLIVHSGSMPSYTNLLIENLHNYFDTFLNMIIDDSIKFKRAQTIEQCILEMNFQYKLILKNLDKHKKSAITLETYKEILCETFT